MKQRIRPANPASIRRSPYSDQADTEVLDGARDRASHAVRRPGRDSRRQDHRALERRHLPAAPPSVTDRPCHHRRYLAGPARGTGRASQGQSPARGAPDRDCKDNGSVALSVVTNCVSPAGSGGGGARILRGRTFCLLIILVSVLTPSVRPLWCGIVTAAVAAWMSRSRPRVKECTWGRSALRVGHPLAEPGVVARAGSQGGEGADQPGQGGHLRAGALQAGERLVLAAGKAVRPGEQDPGGPAR